MRTLASLLPLAVLAACGAGEEAAPPRERDPASEQALADQILVDPDLANQNEGAAALTVSSDHSLPLEAFSPEAAAAARADAAVLVGGSDKLAPVAPAAAPSPSSPVRLRTPAQFAAMLPGVDDCAGALTYSAAWAARLPEALPVYPRGATLEAAGTDRGCSLRAVRFITPVTVDDVLAFYNARARNARFAVAFAPGAGEHVLSGRRGGAAFRLVLHPRADGSTEVSLATIGG